MCDISRESVKFVKPEMPNHFSESDIPATLDGSFD